MNDCNLCLLHKHYLERILKEKENEIVYLKSIISSKYGNLQNANNLLNEIQIEHCIFDIIDYKFNEMDIKFIKNELNSKYPAKKNVEKIISYFINDNNYKIISKNKDIIKYLDSNNKIQEENIQIFTNTICIYIFDKLKPVIEMDCNTKNINEQVEDTSIIRVKNIMMLKDNKYNVDIIKSVIKNNV